MDKVDVQAKVIQSIEQVQFHAAEGSFLSLFVDPDKLMPALLAQINSDVKEKIEQDVELLELAVTGPNTLVVKGRAGAMGIKKEFDVHARLLLDKEAQLVLLKVQDIEVKGGFLIRKGFEMIEPKIRAMIEKSVKISIKELVEKASFSVNVPDSEKVAKLLVQHGYVHNFTLDQDEKLIRIQLDFLLQLHAAM